MVTRLPREQGMWIKCDSTDDETCCPEKVFTANMWTAANREWFKRDGWTRGLRKGHRRRDGVTIRESVMAATRGEPTYPNSRVVRLDTPPYWTEDQGGKRGQLNQQCTQIWKSRPIRRAQSEWLKSLRLKKRIVSWIGYGIDEQGRAIKAAARSAKPGEPKWVRYGFPAIRHLRHREQQRYEIEKWTGRKAPRFSMCIDCPFKTPGRRHRRRILRK